MSVDVFRLPDLGEGLHDAEIVAWHVAEGDLVVADQPLVAVETDKAVVEIPAPQSGRIARCQGQVGDRVEVGAVLVEFGEAGADAGAVVGTIPVAQRGGTDTRAASRAVSSTRSSSAGRQARRRADDMQFVLDDMPDVGEWQLDIRKINYDPLELDELILHIAPHDGAAVDALRDRIHARFEKDIEVTPNRIEVHDLPDMLKRIKLETSLKEVRILDSRPKS